MNDLLDMLREHERLRNEFNSRRRVTVALPHDGRADGVRYHALPVRSVGVRVPRGWRIRARHVAA